MTIAPFWPAFVVAAAALVWMLLLVARGRRDRRTWRRLAAVVLVLAMSLRPAFGTTRAEAQASDLDVLLLVDRTLSMAAEDYDGGRTRMEGVKSDIKQLMTTYAGARFAVMSFTHESYLEVAFTSDTAALQSFVDVMFPVERAYGAGSRVDVAVEHATELLDRVTKQQPDRRRVVVYLGDGEQTSKDARTSFAALKPSLSGALVLGYGTREGGRMKSSPGSSSYVYDDTTRKEALSVIDETTLKQIAEELGGSYAHRSAPGGTISLQVTSGSGGLQSAGPLTARNDLTWALALVLLIPVLWELWETATSARATRRFVSGIETS